MDGKIVYDFIVPLEAGLNTRNINTASLQRGVYLLQVTTADKTDRIKFVKN